MDTGLNGRRALVCGASKGLGRACAMALSAEGVAVTIAARGNEALERTARQIRDATGGDVTFIACDITTPEGRAQALAALPDPDILITNSAGPPPGDFRGWSRGDWIAA
ncbi:MAG TPA: SDR family NAD(P)-dependent oxidoreductase, partial [Ramlibacter sp.]|nr:SDR family NAD(P)-dependent oxidoreductase [Ramlibacter sp.]